MKALIFGINGQDGYYLKQVCEQKQIKVVGVSRSNGNWIQGSVGDWDFVDRVTETHQPDFVFHLAANSTTRHDALLENHETISTGALNVLEAVKRHCPDTKVFITGSGVQFKNAGNPISESDEFEPKSAYSVARIQSVYAARYFRTLGIKVYVGYLFHHESPMRKPEHLSKLIASTVQRIKQGLSSSFPYSSPAACGLRLSTSLRRAIRFTMADLLSRMMFLKRLLVRASLIQLRIGCRNVLPILEKTGTTMFVCEMDLRQNMELCFQTPVQSTGWDGTRLLI